MSVVLIMELVALKLIVTIWFNSF